MTTLDEAIKHAEEVAEEQDKLFKQYDDASRYYRCHDKDIVSANAKKSLECFECAKEHRQLAEWLKDYKRLLEQEPILNKIRAEIEELDRYYDNDYFSTNNCPMYKCNEVLLIIDKYRGESDCRECKVEHDCYDCKKYAESEDD